MKKTLAIILIIALTLTSIVGVAASVAKNNISSKYDPSSIVSSIISKSEQSLPDVTGTWVNENNPHCTAQIVDQNNNKLYLVINSANEDLSKIATAKILVTLNLWNDGVIVRGDSDFNYTDSFDNVGTGRVSISENVITIAIDKADKTNIWGITNASGNYIFEIENTDLY